MQYGRYKILSKLGQGGMATVYLAEDPALSRLVAVKVIQPHLLQESSLLQRFATEARTVAAIRNPNIVEVFDFNSQDDQSYIVMEYMDGPTLGYVCSSFQGKGLPEDITAAFICQAAEGLVAAEKKRVIHRDIKPENLMINSEGYLKIADFGIAHLSEEQSLTVTGDLLGSPNFMSPEQVEGLKPTRKTDLWSLGGILYYCLCGRFPFSAPNITSTLRKIVENDPEPVTSFNKNISAELVELISGLLVKDPDKRLGSAGEVVTRLRGFLALKNITDLQESGKSFISRIDVPQLNTIVETTPSPGSLGTERKRTTGESSTSSKNSWVQTGQGFADATGKAFSHKPSGVHKPLAWAGLILAFILFSISGYLWYAKKQKQSFTPVTEPAITKIIFDSEVIEIFKGESKKMNVTVIPDNADKSLEWSSFDTNIAGVSDEGVIKALAPGNTVIRVRSVKNANIDAVCRLTVLPVKKLPGIQKPVKKQKKIKPTVKKPAKTELTRKKPDPVQGELRILSTPPFASIRVNGIDWGDTPMNKFRKAAAGSVKIELVHRLYPPFDTVITLKKGSKQKIKFNLN